MHLSANAFLSKALGHIKSQKANLLIRVSTYLITYGDNVLRYDFLHEKWLPLSIGYRSFKSFG